MNIPFEPTSIRVGLELFNQGRFFDAHEAWEDVWRDIPRDHSARRHTQGLVQMAVAFHHSTTGNVTGARSVLARSLQNLNGAQSSFSSIDLARLRTEAESWLRYLENVPNELPPPLPKILIRG